MKDVTCLKGRSVAEVKHSRNGEVKGETCNKKGKRRCLYHPRMLCPEDECVFTGEERQHQNMPRKGRELVL